MSKGKARTICFAAFNNAIAKELKERVPLGCEAMTMHSMGYKAVRAAFGNVRVEGNRVEGIISDILGADIFDLRKEHGSLVQVVKQLVGLVKQNMTDLDGDDEEVNANLLSLVSHYEIDLDALPNWEGAVALICETIERCKEVSTDKCIDFSDMVWLPVALELPVFQYDLLLVDEAQDLNRCQQALVKRAGKRLVLCGDPKQAIYGFAGADSESMDRMFAELSPNCEKLHLTVTRRCAKAVVREANKIVANFDAFDTNPEGKVSTASYENANEALTYRAMVRAGDMILCRVNAPLVSQCFRFIKAGRKATIRGRNIGDNLVSTVTKLMKGYKGEPKDAVLELCSRLGAWLDAETKKENKKRFPNEARVIALQDNYDCLMCFTEGASTITDITQKIDTIFSDTNDVGAIALSSIHKAKGLEARRVYLLQPKGAAVPHPMAKTAWQIEQEWNLKYVAITRAIEELVFVS